MKGLYQYAVGTDVINFPLEDYSALQAELDATLRVAAAVGSFLGALFFHAPLLSGMRPEHFPQSTLL
jgi:hypothetical protein